MNTITTEARPGSSGSSTEEGGSRAQAKKPGAGQLWLAILALVAVIGLVAAVAVAAFDSSSEPKPTTVVDPLTESHNFGQDPTPGAASVVVVDPLTESHDFQAQRPAEAGPPASEATTSASAHVTLGADHITMEAKE